jgi:hypothetical protein
VSEESNSGAGWGSPVPPGNEGFGSLSCLWTKVGCLEVVDNKVVQGRKVVSFEALLPIRCIGKGENKLIWDQSKCSL